MKVEQLEECIDLGTYDVVIIGGSFAGVSSAIEWAKAGKKVILIESRTYLGCEMGATLRPWFSVEDKEEVPPLIMKCLENNGIAEMRDYNPINLDKIKKTLEDELFHYDIKLLYATYPVELIKEKDQLAGVIVGNKSGRNLLKTNMVLDTTDTNVACRTAGLHFIKDDMQKPTKFSRTIEFTRVDNLTISTLDVPEYLGLVDNEVQIYPGYRENGHYFIECVFYAIPEDAPQTYMDREIKAREITMETAIYLINKQPEFKKAYLASSSYELFPIIEGTSMNQPNVDNMTTPIKGLFCLPTSLGMDPIRSSKMGAELTRLLLRPNFTSTRLTNFSQTEIPTFKEVDVLVIGGGTSGATAAITSAKEGMETILLEMNPGLGGTGTLGGVDSYWFGRRVGYAEKNRHLVNTVEEKLNYRGGKWNIEAKMYALLHEANKSGVEMYFHMISFDVVKQGNQVKGVFVASPWGVYKFTAKVVIDATGDGDIAVKAGAEFVYGSEKDHSVMWYSLADFAKPGQTKNNFTSMVDVSDSVDYTRAILSGRRRHREAESHDHGIYVAPRETRHVIGDVVMELTDQLLHRKWPDVINIHFSNHDIKGVSGTDWLNTGFIPPNLEIEIPFRMLLPKGLEGILVAGKAISATHDALPAIRMQSDLENLGGVCALAAAQSVVKGVPVREIDIQRLQTRLVIENLLPNEVLRRTLKHLNYTDADLEALVQSLQADQPLYEYANMKMTETFHRRIPFVEVCTVGKRIVPFLENALGQATGDRQILIAQALAMYESEKAVPILFKKIKEELRGMELPIRTSNILYVQLPPDHGAMPEVVYLIYTLGLIKDARNFEVWDIIADKLNPTETDFKEMMKGTFYYVDAVCSGAERLADPRAIPILERIHKNTTLQNQVSKARFQSDYFLERRAMLELSIGRALARCGSKKGYSILISYLEDSRSLLAKNAHLQLKILSEVDYGMNVNHWRMWVQENESLLTPIPYKGKLDRETNSESILRVAVVNEKIIK
ncbi:FAD-dependent oxidoreductase [Lederbergia ruris]|uniref:FAD-dependent oxidoreductase n=1 Tax=Lederbergia ruris TaxID=217495 RepID=UPI0039A0CDCC